MTVLGGQMVVLMVTKIPGVTLATMWPPGLVCGYRYPVSRTVGQGAKGKREGGFFLDPAGEGSLRYS